MRGLAVTVGLMGLLATAAQADTLSRIDASGEIVIGYREAEPPMSFTNENGEAVGYSIDLCRVVAENVAATLVRTDLKMVFVPVTAANRFDAIEAGEIDLLCGATTKTYSRAERVGFSQLTFATGASLLSLEATPVPTVADLAGKSVAVVTGTTTFDALRAAIIAAGIDAEIVTVDTAAAGMTLLDQGEVAAFSSDQVVLIGQMIAWDSGQSYSLADEVLSYEPFALAFARGDADFALVVNRALGALNRSGGIIEVYRSWFSAFSETPPSAVGALYQLNRIPE